MISNRLSLKVEVMMILKSQTLKDSSSKVEKWYGMKSQMCKGFLKNEKFKC